MYYGIFHRAGLLIAAALVQQERILVHRYFTAA